MPKVLITGANGFVGSWLVKESLSRGYETYAAVRPSSSRILLDDPRTHFVEIDFDDISNFKKVLKKYQFDVVIHNAGATRAPNDDIYHKVNVAYSTSLAEASVEVLGGLKKFVYISSIEAYGSADLTPNQVVNNDIIPNPRTSYGKSKLKAEQQLKKIAGLPLIIMRPTAVFGPAERDIFKIWETMKKYRFAPTIGDPDIKYSFVYVKDLARVVIDASISDFAGREYFVSDGRIYKIKQFTGHIANSLGVTPFSFTIPFSILDVAVQFTSLKDKMTGRKSLLNSEQLAKMKARSWDVDISNLVKDFKYQARFNLKEAIDETTAWYLEKGWL